MKKTTLLLLLLSSALGFSQSKSTGVMTLSNSIPISANFTLNNNTSQVTLVVTGPSDRWFGVGIGVNAGFGMSDGDAIIYSTALSDRNFDGFQVPPADASQDWTVVTNVVNGATRTLTLTRALTNTDANDFQMAYGATTSISIAGVRPSSVTNTPAPHGGTANVGYATATFTTLDVEDFSLNASVIFPNPAKGQFTVQTKTALQQIAVYTQTGALVKTIEVNALEQATVNVEGLSTGIYLLELQNDTEKSWKKIIVE